VSPKYASDSNLTSRRSDGCVHREQVLRPPDLPTIAGLHRIFLRCFIEQHRITLSVSFWSQLRGFCVCVGASVLAVAGHAQSSASSSLIVSMTVQSSISLVFVNVGAAGALGTCSIKGANTNAASVNFGTASLAGDDQPCVGFAANGASSYTLSNNIYLLVTQSNVTSANYTLTATLPSAPLPGVSWSINKTPLSTAPTTLTAGGTYDNNFGMYTQVTVQHTVAAGNLSQVINLLATAN
jgi:hypothetical protein